ncbi:MAG: sulfatase-like hydrolase/transferase [Planctomycetota bacterium]
MQHFSHQSRFTALLILALGFSLAVTPFPAAADHHPNIVIILADDLGYGDVSFNPQHAADASTPNIDRLAKDGVVMTNGYVTAPNCAPARAALMTGRYQQRFGLYSPSHSRAGIPVEEVLLPAVIGKAGYTSGIFGKWHLGFAPEDNPVERGFDEFYGFLGHGGHDYFKLAAPAEGEPVYQAIRRGHRVIDDEGYLTRRITEEAIDFIKRHEDKPFFAYVAYNAPHSPLQAPEEYIKRHNTGDKDRDTYLAMVEIMDEGIGEIIDALKAQGDYDNTLIFFLSDNGGARAVKANNAPLNGYKQLMYEGGLRVPFVVTWPAQLEAGTTSDVPVVCFDIFSTAAAVAGVDVPQDRPIDGKNLLPAVRKEVDQLHDAIFWSQPQNKREHWAVRMGNTKKLINRGTPGLFNLSQDIGESSNLVDSQADRARELEALFRSWESGMGAPLADELHHRRRAPLMTKYRDASFLEWRKENGERW